MIINRQTPQRLIGAQLAAQGYIKPSKRSCPVLTDAIVDVQLLHCVLVVRRLQELVQIDIFQAVVAATVRDPRTSAWGCERETEPGNGTIDYFP